MTNWTFETRIDKRGAVWQMKDKPVCVTEGLTMTADSWEWVEQAWGPTTRVDVVSGARSGD